MTGIETILAWSDQIEQDNKAKTVICEHCISRPAVGTFGDSRVCDQCYETIVFSNQT